MKKYKIIAIMGKAGSGKDSLLHAIIQNNPNLHTIVSNTTRPIRENETNGVDYWFISNEEFTNQVLNGEMLEATVFNDWCYGTSIHSLSEDEINIGVFNPEGIKILLECNNIDLNVVYITASDKTRLLRQLNREEYPDCKEIVRRFGTDEVDFNDKHLRDIFTTTLVLCCNNDDMTDLNELAQVVISEYSWTK